MECRGWYNMQNTKDSLYVGEEYWKQHIDELVTKNQWKRLLTATFILELLLESDSYGNKLEKDIHARTKKIYKPNPNELYPVLRLMEERGFVKSQWDSPDKRSKRIYQIMDTGREAYPYMKDKVLEWVERFEKFITAVRDEFSK